ncbi:MAG TPA: hypothetical protein VHU61_06550 [Solirubrobacteraceae bacterium]|jgi:hypothetical protein|nr:hypothetical protein [Solirubrobacteraceae bacterium]
MLSRTLAASVLPREGRLRSALPSLRQVRLRLAEARHRSLLIQERMEADRVRRAKRHGHGLR